MGQHSLMENMLNLGQKDLSSDIGIDSTVLTF